MKDCTKIMMCYNFEYIKRRGTRKMKKFIEEFPAEPETKICPYCQSEISIKATRCPHCTSILEETKAE